MGTLSLLGIVIHKSGKMAATHIERDADEDEKKIGRGEAGQKRVGDGLEPAVARDGADDERIAADAQQEDHQVDDHGRHQLRPVVRLEGFVDVVVVVDGGGRRRRRRRIHRRLCC